mmetsp:Transcript_201/g.638  ORF Transcript_201/g.638 Transcript_201/m.638 type:complete len:369 (-) Transcript_201:682-1788(-)
MDVYERPRHPCTEELEQLARVGVEALAHLLVGQLHTLRLGIDVPLLHERLGLGAAAAHACVLQQLQVMQPHTAAAQVGLARVGALLAHAIIHITHVPVFSLVVSAAILCDDSPSAVEMQVGLQVLQPHLLATEHLGRWQPHHTKRIARHQHTLGGRTCRHNRVLAARRRDVLHHERVQQDLVQLRRGVDWPVRVAIVNTHDAVGCRPDVGPKPADERVVSPADDLHRLAGQRQPLTLQHHRVPRVHTLGVQLPLRHGRLEGRLAHLEQVYGGRPHGLGQLHSKLALHYRLERHRQGMRLTRGGGWVGGLWRGCAGGLGRIALAAIGLVSLVCRLFLLAGLSLGPQVHPLILNNLDGRGGPHGHGRRPR